MEHPGAVITRYGKVHFCFFQCKVKCGGRERHHGAEQHPLGCQEQCFFPLQKGDIFLPCEVGPKTVRIAFLFPGEQRVLHPVG